MNIEERQQYINQLKKDIIEIRRKILDERYNDDRFRIYKDSNRYLLWLKENGMLKTKFIKKWIEIPQDLLNYIENNKEIKNVDSK